MTFSRLSNTVLAVPSIETLMETLDGAPQNSLIVNDAELVNDAEPHASLSYRSSPDGSLTMATDPLSGQVALIVQNAAQLWEIALPPKIARFAASESRNSLAGAKQLAEDAFRAYWASRGH